MDLNEFEKRFGTEQQCRKYIADLIWPSGYRCPRCQSHKAWITKEYKYKCQNCGYKASVTAGTIFQDSHIALPIWFKALLIISIYPEMNSQKLMKELKIGSNRTALSMMHKLRSIMIYPVLDKLQGSVELFTTDIKIHNKSFFIAIADELVDKKIGRIRIEIIRRGFKEDLVEFIKKCIVPGSILIHKEVGLYNHPQINNKYIYGHKPHNYSFVKSKQIAFKLQNWLNTCSGIEPTISLNEFCMRVNSLKTNITFEDLIYNAVNLKTSLNSKNIYGIKI